jgi:pimeloyl-ACP methyl ester carboxylesterase
MATKKAAVTSGPTPVQHSIGLSDGRRVAYWEMGHRDSPVVLYCHGTPGSGLELSLARDALRRGDVEVRLIGLNRPGYGGSTFVSRHGFVPWARTVEEVLDRIGVDELTVIGASGGSPFALACAHTLLARIRRVAIVAGVAPPATDGMEASATLTQESHRTWVRRIRYGALAMATRAGLEGWLANNIVAALSQPDREAMADSAVATSFRHVLEEAFAHMGRAAALEAGLFMKPWDFDPALVTQPVGIWHGEMDNRIPARVAPSFAASLPNATCVLWPDHGHFSWAMSDDLNDVVSFLGGGSSERGVL